MSLEEILRERSEDQPNGCRIWTGGTTDRGYGRVSVCGVYVRVHRAAFEIANAVTLTPAIPVHHTCANRLCIKPEHLQVVTPAENTAEMLERRYYLNYIKELEDQLAIFVEYAKTNY